MVKISLCTTCHNRTYQLRQVFDANIRTLEKNPDVEWVLLNYNSSDNLHEFITERLPLLPSRFIYAVDNIPKRWHAGIANNISHRCANTSSTVLMNLDVDNLIGNSISVVRENMVDRGIELLHNWSGDYHDGTYGRIAMTKEKFYALGGYDESFYPMGYQDTDIMNRARAMGSTYLHVNCGNNLAILNSKEDWLVNCKIPGMTWRDFNRVNKNKSISNIESGKFTVVNDWKEFDVKKTTGNQLA